VINAFCGCYLGAWDSIAFLMTNILTIDLEDWFQVDNFKHIFPVSTWDTCELRVEKNILKLLQIFDKFNTKTTFFVLGWIAEKCPDLIREIHKQGHEIATHGFNHQLVCSQTREEFKQDLQRSIDVLSKITGENPRGFRAPTWSINQNCPWAFDVMRECGIEYDSSLFPGRFTSPSSPRGEVKAEGSITWSHEYVSSWELTIKFADGSELTEYPITTVKICGKSIPFSGGGYFRLFPYSFISWGIKKLNNQGIPAIVYLHPWEIDPQQPRQNAGALKNFRHYVNMEKTEDKLCKLLKEFKFTSFK